jgi:hypothetical protein
LEGVLKEFMKERKERDDEIEEIKATAGVTIRNLMD